MHVVVNDWNCCLKLMSFNLVSFLEWVVRRQYLVLKLHQIILQNLAVLDASKAFNRVNHFTLLNKLVHISVLLCLLNIFLCWFLKLYDKVIWNRMFSSVFYMKSGVGQGRINYPWFYNVYMNDIIVKLRNI